MWEDSQMASKYEKLLSLTSNKERVAWNYT